MQGFSSPLTSKEQLEEYTKEELMDMYWNYTKDVNKFIEHILNCSDKERNELKDFFNTMKQVETMSNEEKEKVVQTMQKTVSWGWLIGLMVISSIFNKDNDDN